VATRRGRQRPSSSGFVARRLWLLGLTLACVVLLIIGRNATSIIDVARQHITDWSAPALEWASGPVERMRRFGSRVGSYDYLSGEVNRLRRENEDLRTWKMKALELETRVRRYEELLNARREPETKFVTARVIADARGPFVRTVIINAGSAHGVRAHQAVMDGHGLVGRTVTAGQDASRVLLVSDLNSRIPVRIEPNGYRAILTGTNRSDPRLEFLPDRVTVRDGDTVFTSGDGGQLPPGLPVGVVAADQSGAFRVELYAEPARLSYVRILDYAPSLKIDAQSLTPVEQPTTTVAGTAEDDAAAAGDGGTSQQQGN
jgi:rod shape-determining protein MreC